MGALGTAKATERARKSLMEKSGLAAASGVTDLAAQLGSFADMVQVPPPPRVKIMLSDKETVAVISEALLMTADKINAGEPIDSHRSITAARRGPKH